MPDAIFKILVKMHEITTKSLVLMLLFDYGELLIQFYRENIIIAMMKIKINKPPVLLSLSTFVSKVSRVKTGRESKNSKTNFEEKFN